MNPSRSPLVALWLATVGCQASATRPSDARIDAPAVTPQIEQLARPEFACDGARFALAIHGVDAGAALSADAVTYGIRPVDQVRDGGAEQRVENTCFAPIDAPPGAYGFSVCLTGLPARTNYMLTVRAAAGGHTVQTTMFLSTNAPCRDAGTDAPRPMPPPADAPSVDAPVDSSPPLDVPVLDVVDEAPDAADEAGSVG